MAVQSPFPTPGQDPWTSIVQWAEEVEQTTNSTEQEITEGRLSPDELSATYGGRRLLGPRVVFDGDSITISGTTTSANVGGQDRGGSWVRDFAARSGGRINYVYNAGVSGARLDHRLAAFDASVATHAPDTIVLSIGTNDLGQGRTYEAFEADLDAYLAKTQGIGAQLVLSAIYPRADHAATVADWNRRLAKWALAHNIILIPFWELSDPDTGAFPAGWSTDGIHPDSESAAMPTMGKFAWDYTRDAWMPNTIPTPSYSGENLIPNGFFTQLDPPNTATVSITALTATTGTLPPGTYEYRVAPANVWGKNANSDTESITLTEAGGVTLNRTYTGSFSQLLVYRKGPGDEAFRFVASVSGVTTTWTDDGTATPGHEWVDGDFSVRPTGWGISQSAVHNSMEFGTTVQTPPGIRGNAVRSVPYFTDMYREDFFTIEGISPNAAYDFSCLVRGSLSVGNYATVYVRFRTAEGAIGQAIVWRQAIDEEWKRIHIRFTTPPNTDRLRIALGGTSGQEWVEMAEAYLAPA